MNKLISILETGAVLCFFGAIPAGAQDPNGGAAPASLGNFPPTIFASAAQDPIVGGGAVVTPAGEVTVAGGQDPMVGGVAAPYVPFSADALDQLLRPIALYPDPLLAEVLTASSIPGQLVMADRYVNGGGDLTEIADQQWDPSVQALAHYPTVLKWLDDNLPWTTQVGDAFLNQQQDVMASIQRLRMMAQSQGNLPSTPQENVVADSGTIEIVPADPYDIYVPIYPWNSIYYGPNVFCTFGVGFSIGPWLVHDWDWRNHHLFVWGPGHPRPASWWTGPAHNRVAPPNATYWHGPVRAAVAVSGRADRGFGSETVRNTRLAAPSTPAPPREVRPGTVSSAPGGRTEGGHTETVPGISTGVGRGSTAPGTSAGVGRGSTAPGTSTEIGRGSTAPGTPTGVGRSSTAPGTSTEIGRSSTISPGSRAGVQVGSVPGISRPAPEVHAISGGSSIGSGAFGGSESALQARESSARGVESRSTISAPPSRSYEAPAAPAPHSSSPPAAPASHSSSPPSAPASHTSSPPASSGSSHGK